MRTYRHVVPFVETSRRDTPYFQIPDTIGSFSQEAEEDLKIIGMFQYFAHYNMKMEQTRIELSILKLLCNRNETKKQELEAKLISIT